MARKRNSIDDRRETLDEARDMRSEFGLDCRLRGHNAFHRYGLRFAELPAAESDLGQQHVRHLLRMAWLIHPQSRTALNHRAMKQILRRRHRKQRRDFLPAARLTEDRYFAGIAAELRYVVTHPLQSRDQIQHPNVARPAKFVIAASESQKRIA